MNAEPCAGVWVNGRNQCPCDRCRRIEAARSDYVTASERVCRLVNQGDGRHADPDILQIARAEVARERAGERWREAARETDAATETVA